MASTAVTQFPPPTYSSSYFVRTIIKEFIHKHTDGHSKKHPPHASSSHQGDTKTADKRLDFGDFWRSKSPSNYNALKDDSAPHVAAAATPTSTPPPPASTPAALSTFRKWRKGGSRPQDRVDENSAKGPNHANGDEDRSLLKFLALNALDLTAPASDILLKNRQNSWFQLSGHSDCFAPAGPGTIWKKRSGGAENRESLVYEALSKDPALCDAVPHFFREVEYNGQKFMELQDLLHGFTDPHVMDLKMGTRTFLESEVQKVVERHDLYQKMVAVDPNAPTEEEHKAQAITKLRYMQFREQQSSTCSHGFRIEAMKFRGCSPVTDLKKVKTREEVLLSMALFLGCREDTRQRLLVRLREIRDKFQQSDYFRTHEIIGSSIFMIYDDNHVGAWIIDFAKTNPIPVGLTIDHRQPWVQGNHEEGFLFGLDSLITVLQEVDLQPSSNHKLSPMPLNTVPFKS